MSTTTPPAYAPTVADVAAMIRARTKDSNGNELGTFTTDTRPTDAQAQEAIDHAVLAIHQKVGEVSAHCTDVARMCATYGAAAEIELSYFPEQARTDRSPYTFLIARWTETLEGVHQCVLGNLPGGVGPDPTTGWGQGTLQAYSGTAWDFYTGETGILGNLPPPPAPPVPPLPPEGGGMPVVVNKLNLAGVNVLDVPAGTTAINVTSTVAGAATLAGIQIDGAAPPDGYELIVRQVYTSWPAGEVPPDEAAILPELVKLQLNHAAAGKAAIVELGAAPDHIPSGSPLIGWLLTYVAAHNGWTFFMLG